MIEDCTQNAATRIQGHATPGRIFAPPPGLAGYIPPFTATSQPPPFPTVHTLGGQISAPVAPLIASRDNLGNVMSILPPGRVRPSVEDEVKRMRADQEKREDEMRRQFEAEKKRMEQQHRVELERRE